MWKKKNKNQRLPPSMGTMLVAGSCHLMAGAKGFYTLGVLKEIEALRISRQRNQ